MADMVPNLKGGKRTDDPAGAGMENWSEKTRCHPGHENSKKCEEHVHGDMI